MTKTLHVLKICVSLLPEYLYFYHAKKYKLEEIYKDTFLSLINFPAQHSNLNTKLLPINVKGKCKICRTKFSLCAKIHDKIKRTIPWNWVTLMHFLKVTLCHSVAQVLRFLPKSSTTSPLPPGMPPKWLSDEFLRNITSKQWTSYSLMQQNRTIAIHDTRLARANKDYSTSDNFSLVKCFTALNWNNIKCSLTLTNASCDTVILLQRFLTETKFPLMANHYKIKIT